MIEITVILLLISVLCLWGVVLIHVYGAVDSNGNIIQEKKEIKLECLVYSDGTLAVIQYSSRGDCGPTSGAMNTISWFLKQGYHIDAAVPTVEEGNFMNMLGTVFMTR